jgi:hypothetical protein
MTKPCWRGGSSLKSRKARFPLGFPLISGVDSLATGKEIKPLSVSCRGSGRVLLNDEDRHRLLCSGHFFLVS